MNKKFQKRKKQFWAFAIASLLTVGCLEPLTADAIYISGAGGTSDEAIIWENEHKENQVYPTSLQPGDILNIEFSSRAAYPEIAYRDADGETVNWDFIRPYWIEANEGIYYHNVKAYESIPGFTNIPEGQFKEWKIETVTGSAGYFQSVVLVAVPYSERTVTYVLGENEENASENITTYTEGKTTFTFKSANKIGYTFQGWYTDAELTNEITEIALDTTGDLTLYPKFVAEKYAIEYHLDDGENASENPDTYEYGVGVESFKDAVKEGYDFAGWYLDSDLTEHVTAISATHSGDIDLFAKFVVKEVISDDNEDEAPVDDDNTPVDDEIETPDDKVETPDDDVEIPVDDEVETPVDDEVETPVDGDVETPVDDEVETPVDDEVETPVDDEVEAPVDDEVEAPAGDNKSDVPKTADAGILSVLCLMMLSGLAIFFVSKKQK